MVDTETKCDIEGYWCNPNCPDLGGGVDYCCICFDMVDPMCIDCVKHLLKRKTKEAPDRG